MERVFETTQYPDSLTMEDLADKLEISHDKVFVSMKIERYGVYADSIEQEIPRFPLELQQVGNSIPGDNLTSSLRRI